MACTQELNGLPVINGCPGSNEIFFVANAIGGQQPGGYGWRKWSDIKNCIVGTVVPPYIGVVDRGNQGDPISGTSMFQDNSLIGLGATNNGDIQMVIDEVLMSTFGLNASFTYDPILGEVDISPNTFQPGSGVFIDRNQ